MEVSILKQLAKKQLHQEQVKLGQIRKLTQLDKHFWTVLPFMDLKLFLHYSKVVQ